MRTPTQQTLDTRITPTPVATAIPVRKQSGGFSHGHLTNDGLAHTARLLHKAAY